jgi:hypothetical protein
MTEELLLEWAAGLGLKTLAGREALRVAIENVQLLDRKQQDYGPANISAFGLFGCVVRANDKVERLKNLKNYGREQKAAMKKLREVINHLERDWHKLNILQTLDHLEDAMTQFKVLFAKKRKPVINETLRDTFRDISNYAIIALLLDSGRWPTEEQDHD